MSYPKRPSVNATPKVTKSRDTGLKTYFAGWISEKHRIAWVISEPRLKLFTKGNDYNAENTITDIDC